MTRLTKTIWTIGFLIGFITHSLDILQYGWLPYNFRPLGWNLYWTSLTFLDPLAAGLIWVRERWAIILGTAIMASNIAINGYTYLIGYEEFFYPLMMQSAFAGFVFLTASRHWKAQVSISSPP
ncbi:MAG: hypothetical protein AAGH57_00415 [Pseudomonadota bacterium]